MAELLLVRHGQASFGADDYDRLSDLGHQQAKALGVHLRALNWVPDRLVTGTLTRQVETIEGLGLTGEVETHAGFNEYSIDAGHYGQQAAASSVDGRKAYFRALRDIVFQWQADTLGQSSESWAEFVARTDAALDFATDTQARRVLVVSSGGVIGGLVARMLQAPDAMMMELNLQIKNAAVTKVVFSGKRRMLQEFNATPHLDLTPEMITHS